MSEDKHFFYANSVEIAVSTYDVNLKFMRTGTPKSTMQPGMQQVQPELLDEMVIGMSPQHAKALLPALAQALQQYETQFINQQVTKK